MAYGDNDSPGKRLKREEAKNTLYVSRPDDPRLQMYRDSLEAAVPAILANKQIRYMNMLPMPKRREYYENVYYEKENEKEDKRFKPPMSSYAAQIRLERANKKPYGIETNRNVKTTIEPEKGYSYGWDTPGDSRKFSALTELGLVEHLPKRKVVFRPEEPIEPLAPRQATLAPQEIIAPVLRPVLQSNLEPQDGPMGLALRYPAQTFMNRVKARITGNPNMPYWVDREGVKRYPSMGENSPEEVRMMEILRGGLDSNSPEDVSELNRIEMLRKMSPKERRKYMDSERIAQE